jgi:hypothetical protein
MLKPNLIVDKPLTTTILKLKLKDIPSLNTNSGVIDAESIFHYKIKLYERVNGSKYYVFYELTDCSLPIINCNKEIYDILQNYIPIDDAVEVWQPTNNSYELIPTTYRHTKWYEGNLNIEEM